MGLRGDRDGCPFRRNSAGSIQWSLKTPSGSPGRVLRSQEGDFRAFPATIPSRIAHTPVQSDGESCYRTNAPVFLVYPALDTLEGFS